MKFLPIVVALLVPLTATADTSKIAKAAKFEYGQIRLRSEARKELAAFAKSWREHPTQVRIEGHGYTNDEEVSIELGQRRADRVRDFLVKHGVDAGAITAIGHSRGERGRYVDLVLEPQTK